MIDILMLCIGGLTIACTILLWDNIRLTKEVHRLWCILERKYKH